MRRQRWLMGLLAALALFAVACGGSDETEAEADADAESGTDEVVADTDDDNGDTEADEADDTQAADDAASDDGGDTEAAAPSGEPIVIGTLTSLNGPFTPWGIQVRDGMQMAADDINAAGGIDGRPIQIELYDDQSNGEEGIKGIERLIEDGAIAIGGPISSDVGLATATIAEEVGVPLFLTKAGAAGILTPESRYTFRTCIPAAPMVAQPVLQFAQNEGLSKVGAIIADYGWGQGFKTAMEDTFADSGIEIQIEVAPVGEQDFTTYLRKLQEFEPELLVATGHPPGSPAITAQSAELGLDVPVTGAYSTLSAVMNGVGETGVDRYADFVCADFDSPEYQELAARFVADTDNDFMEADAISGYGIVTAVAEAVTEVGDDPAAISEYLHATTFDLPGYAYPMSWTEWGEMAEAAPLFVQIGAGPAPEGLNGGGDWWPTVLNKTDPLTPYEP